MSIPHALLALAVLAGTPQTNGASTADSPAGSARQAVQRSLAFLGQDALTWRDEHECATCHHGAMTVWALSEARSRGHAVDAGAYSTIVEWTKGRFLQNIDRPRDERPGYSMVSLGAIYLAMTARTVDGQEAISDDELSQIAGHLVRHQEPDGSWSWASAPPLNRPPPAFESDEVATLLAYLALQTSPSPAPMAEDPVREGRAKAQAWLDVATPTGTTQALALRVLRVHQGGAGDLSPQIDDLLARQNADGGWGQLDDLDSDAYATGQVLYALNLAGVPRDRAEIERGVSFLVATQREDGSWTMTSRAHPGEQPYTNPVPITHFGSAWGTLGLVRSTPEGDEAAP